MAVSELLQVEVNGSILGDSIPKSQSVTKFFVSAQNDLGVHTNVPHDLYLHTVAKISE